MRRATRGLAVAVAMLCCGPVQAGSWTGFYLGLGGGIGMTNHELNFSEGPLIPPGIDFDVNLDGIGGDGGFFTLSAGADYQLNNRLVIGAFIDYDFMSLESDLGLSASIPPFGSISANASIEVENQLAIGGRFGYVMSPATLVFVTAGYSHVDVSDLDFSVSAGGFALNDTLARVGDLSGYFLGGGVETRVAKNFTIKAEYRYTDLDAETIELLPNLFPAVNDFVKSELATTIQSVRLTLNYRFNGGSEDDSTADDSGATGASWTGPYLGVGFGYGAANNEINVSEGPALPPGLFNVNLDGVGHRGELFSIGGGYDFQAQSRFVIGVLIDVDLANIDHGDSVRFSFGGPSITAQLDASFDQLVMVGGRAGYLTSPDTLAFISFGYAHAELTDTTFQVTTPGLPFGGVLIDGKDFSGFFVGGGIESRLMGNVTLKAEYRYIDLGSETMTLLPDLAPAINDFVTTEFEPVIQTGRLSLNYRFNGPN